MTEAAQPLSKAFQRAGDLLAEEAHRGRDEEDPDDRGIEEDRDRHRVAGVALRADGASPIVVQSCLVEET